jgi:4-oxalocrotonate tautomerase family enzyme
MPLVKIEIFKGKSDAYKKTLLDCVHQSLVAAIGIPGNDRMQRLYELDAANFETKDDKTDAFTIIEITLFMGRSREAKKKLYAALVASLKESLGINPNDVFIVLNEVPLENWGIRGGQMADEVNLGFNVKV